MTTKLCIERWNNALSQVTLGVRERNDKKPRFIAANSVSVFVAVARFQRVVADSYCRDVRQW